MWVIMIRRFTLAITVVVSGCAGTSEQISSELARSGLDARQSRCIGDRLAADLSFGELRQLGRAARVYQQASKTPGGLTVSDLIRLAAQFDDARVPLVVGLATVGCGVLAAPSQ